MTPPRDFLPLMLQTITVQHQSAVDKYGKPSWGSSDSYRCRIMNTERMVRDSEGREIVEAGRAVVWGVVSGVSVKDRIVLPDGSTPPVVTVSTMQDTTGDHHSVIGFGQ